VLAQTEILPVISLALTTMRPQARKEQLLVHDLDDETLVYDLARDRAHMRAGYN
jgi:hypothetical protein